MVSKISQRAENGGLENVVLALAKATLMVYTLSKLSRRRSMTLMQQLFEAEKHQQELEKQLADINEEIGAIKLLMAVISDDHP